MTAKVYYDLREQLDQYSMGFPSTESGVEIRILEKLFSEEQAELYLNLTLVPETVEEIARRIGRPSGEVAALLDRMVDKGLTFRAKEGDTARFQAVPFVIGLIEFQIKDMDKELAELFERYLLEAFGKEVVAQTLPLRTVPVNKSVDRLWPVAPYDDVKRIFQTEDKISVTNCICRVQQGLLGKRCDKPLEVCFMFGKYAQYYVDKGMGRFVTQKEGLQIIDKCDEYGLVPQPFIAKEAGVLCNCCGDCCGVLRCLKMHPKPAERVLTNYYAAVDPDACSACETCTDRCQMEAIKVGVDEVAKVDRDRCIGCGLCVTTCPSEAVSLRLKPESERQEPPETGEDYILELALARGKSVIPLAISTKS